MTVFVREYVHLASLGDLEACRAVKAEIGLKLRRLHERGLIDGYEARVLHEAAGAEEAFVWCEYAALTEGRFPFAYACWQPTPGAQDESVHPLLVEHGFTPIPEPAAGG